MKKLKVVHIIPMLGPGGAERVAVHIVKGLNRQRFDPRVISIWRRVGCDLESQLDDARVPVQYLGKGPGFDGRAYHRLHRALRTLRPEIVHSHLHVLRYALPSLLLLKGMSTLHTVHNLAEREVESRARCIQRYAFNHGVVPVAVSDEVAQSLKPLYGIHSCRVIPNGIPTSQYAHPSVSRKEWRVKAGFRDDHVLFVCVARFAEQKNHALLLDAFAKRPAANPNAHLVLVGDGPLREQLQAQAKSLGLAERIHFMGVRTDIPEILKAMDVFVLSSDWEGNPLSVMEAMAAGLPIISTAVGGVPGLLSNGKEGLLEERGDAAGLANSMAFLLESPDARRAMGAAAAQRAKAHFDVSAMVQQYEQLYEHLFDHSHHLTSEKSLHTSHLSFREA
jgi:glycosyltransferase involved in cell wall biosynthesis